MLEKYLKEKQNRRHCVYLISKWLVIYVHTNYVHICLRTLTWICLWSFSSLNMTNSNMKQMDPLPDSSVLFCTLRHRVVEVGLVSNEIGRRRRDDEEKISMLHIHKINVILSRRKDEKMKKEAGKRQRQTEALSDQNNQPCWWWTARPCSTLSHHCIVTGSEIIIHSTTNIIISLNYGILRDSNDILYSHKVTPGLMANNMGVKAFYSLVTSKLKKLCRSTNKISALLSNLLHSDP